MPIEDGDMKRRWEKRERMRQQAKKQQKRLILGLIVAGAVLLAVAALILGITIFSKSRSRPQAETTVLESTDPALTQPEDTAPTTPPDTTPVPTTTGADTTVITLAAAGDLNITDKTIAAGGIMYNYTNAFMDVVPLLSGADITVMNFEGILSGDTYGTATRAAPQSMADALRNAGVDLVQVANSWSLKNNLIGLDNTLSGFRGAGVEPLGAYRTNKEASRGGGYTICTVRGIRIAFVAFTKGMDSGVSLPVGSENCVNVLYTDYNSTYRRVDTEGIQRVLDNVADEDPDLVVAMVHWGSEYNDTIGDTQKDIRDLMFSSGVDAILGTHSHYLQAMEYNSKNGQFIAYSLGDFFGDAERSGTAYSVVLNLEITKDNRSGDTKITGYSYTPIYTTEDSQGLLRVMRMESAIKAYEDKYLDRVSESVYQDMLHSLERIESRIHAEVKD